jgi:hypothetical protein
MSRPLIAILLSSALVFGSVITNAAAAPIVRNAVQTDIVQTAPVDNQAPLPAGNAAGIKQAQGGGVSPALAIGIVAGLFILGVLLIGDNDDEDDTTTPSTTRSN